MDQGEVLEARMQGMVREDPSVDGRGCHETDLEAALDLAEVGERGGARGGHGVLAGPQHPQHAGDRCGGGARVPRLVMPEEALRDELGRKGQILPPLTRLPEELHVAQVQVTELPGEERPVLGLPRKGEERGAGGHGRRTVQDRSLGGKTPSSTIELSPTSWAR